MRERCHALEALTHLPCLRSHGRAGRKCRAGRLTADPFPDLSAQKAIISDACGGAITLGDQSFIVQAVPDDDFGVAAGQTRSLYVPFATEDACALEA